MRLRIIPDILGDLHRAEFRPAHAAEVRHFVRLLRQRLVMVFSRPFGVGDAVHLDAWYFLETSEQMGSEFGFVFGQVVHADFLEA